MHYKFISNTRTPRPDCCSRVLSALRPKRQVTGLKGAIDYLNIEQLQREIRRGSYKDARFAHAVNPTLSNRNVLQYALEKYPNISDRDRGSLDQIVTTLIENVPPKMIACVDLNDRYSASALHLVAKFGTPEMLRKALKGVVVDRKTAVGVTPLLSAIGEGRVDNATVLLDAGADQNHVDGFGWSCLHHAAKLPTADMTRLLMERRVANPNHRNQEERTPLYMAIRYGHADSMRLILEAGADVNARLGRADSHYNTPLLATARYGDEEKMRVLLSFDPEDRGINFQVAGMEYTFTPMQLAAVFNAGGLTPMEDVGFVSDDVWFLRQVYYPMFNRLYRLGRFFGFGH